MTVRSLMEPGVYGPDKPRQVAPGIVAFKFEKVAKPPH